MRIQDIDIIIGDPDAAWTPLRRLVARCEATTALSRAPSIDEVNAKLREMAAGIGANAVIRVKYHSGVSWTSWKSIRGDGLAVKVDTDETRCEICAETIKRAARKCRFCGADMPESGQAASVTSVRSRDQKIIPDLPPLRSTNNPQLWIVVSIVLWLLMMWILFVP